MNNETIRYVASATTTDYDELADAASRDQIARVIDLIAAGLQRRRSARLEVLRLIADAHNALERMTTEKFATGADRSTREDLAVAALLLGADPAACPYPKAITRWETTKDTFR